ncbi:uncharacterized protein Z520_02448 [Fonsecaea multimorphosa CBS 102226]|uniref:Uncharacterized protein n=1 Tax=Fonsecaea multimorphosa CBS 102226 TaxID=1442371 RepID=A0A0D2KFQ6_9EURO|nr:uncharacterized protein Z520_02448 [Fonsecaea multimorphosa CBS 102226]KIY02310.1 hypothetical protein Z520_02448 [Fonsecaea multimorphosa CBS 102226]OAL28956.1 hypothetical protein AYO22_02392 [Fonsecaea multimorphosa]
MAENDARIQKLESVVQGMIDAFLGFGDHVTRSMAVPTISDSRGLGTAYHEAVEKFRNLAAEIDEDVCCSQDQSPNSTSGDCQQAVSQSILQTSSRPQSKLLWTSQHPPVFKTSVKAADNPTPESSYNMHRFLSSAIILMPNGNPVLSGDYSDIKELSFPGSSVQQRLFRHGMWRNYQALHCDEFQDKRYSWCDRVHGFSFRHSSRSDLLFLTRLGLDKMIEESHRKTHGRLNGQASPPEHAPGNRIFDDEKHHQLAAAIQNDLELEGILSDIVRAEEIDHHLAKKGRTILDGNRLELRLFPIEGCWSHTSKGPSPNEDIQTVVIDTERFVRKLCDEAICLGNGMGFSKHIINDAIVYSALHVSQLRKPSLPRLSRGHTRE